MTSKALPAPSSFRVLLCLGWRALKGLWNILKPTQGPPSSGGFSSVQEFLGGAQELTCCAQYLYLGLGVQIHLQTLSNFSAALQQLQILYINPPKAFSSPDCWC